MPKILQNDKSVLNAFVSYPKKQQIVPVISIKCDQAHLGILLTNQITEFMKVQYLQKKVRDESEMPRQFRKNTQGTFKMRSLHYISQKLRKV